MGDAAVGEWFAQALAGRGAQIMREAGTVGTTIDAELRGAHSTSAALWLGRGQASVRCRCTIPAAVSETPGHSPAGAGMGEYGRSARHSA